jgi:hypothetical protein
MPTAGVTRTLSGAMIFKHRNRCQVHFSRKFKRAQVNLSPFMLFFHNLMSELSLAPLLTLVRGADATHCAAEAAQKATNRPISKKNRPLFRPAKKTAWQAGETCAILEPSFG